MPKGKTLRKCVRRCFKKFKGGCCSGGSFLKKVKKLGNHAVKKYGKTIGKTLAKAAIGSIATATGNPEVIPVANYAVDRL